MDALPFITDDGKTHDVRAVNFSPIRGFDFKTSSIIVEDMDHNDVAVPLEKARRFFGTSTGIRPGTAVMECSVNDGFVGLYAMSSDDEAEELICCGPFHSFDTARQLFSILSGNREPSLASVT